ncbi:MULTISPECIES: aspartate aminotransferase family protein [unclassified Streptomyces]|uniref:aspartate aminotransferase family protein n=1 Tax=unclassified Streptomyces TaxID=2593676 RepID=UPI0013150232|nr:MULTISPECIES: aspartate aminotransferase family protein [unclassified Streptomyces]
MNGPAGAHRADVLFPTLLGNPTALSAQGAWIDCDDGRRYLDAVAGPGVHALGHGHPRITEAISRQSRRLTHSSFLLNEPVVELARRLVELAGPPFSRVFFANSGGEAVETAVKAAKKYSARRGRYGNSLVALENGYHGRSGISLALTGMSLYKRGLPGFSLYPGVVHVAVPGAGEDSTDLGRTLDARLQDGLVAVVAEPVLGVGGAITPSADFLRALRTLCDERGALLVFDEVFTGFGRTGSMFAFQHSGVVPDILVVGKALGGGLPVGAVIAGEEIGTCWEPVEHSTTFGGNVALTAAVGLAVLDEITEAKLPEAAASAGRRLLDDLTTAARGNPAVRDVRGRGLLLGVECADRRRAGALMAALRTAGVLTSGGGQDRTTVRLTPPLNITASETGLLSEAACSALAEVAG